jgi:hypothetical protein
VINVTFWAFNLEDRRLGGFRVALDAMAKIKKKNYAPERISTLDIIE